MDINGFLEHQKNQHFVQGATVRIGIGKGKKRVIELKKGIIICDRCKKVVEHTDRYFNSYLVASWGNKTVKLFPLANMKKIIDIFTERQTKLNFGVTI